MRVGTSRHCIAVLLLALSCLGQSAVTGQDAGQTPLKENSQPAFQTPARDNNAAAAQLNQETPQQPNVGFSNSAATLEPTPPTQPEWYPLPADQQQHVDQLLDFWQKSSEQIRQCTCEFTRWDYDPNFCAYRNPQTQELAAFAVWKGEIRFAAPDKAMLETNELWRFAMQGDQPGMEKCEDQNLKLKWICDGKYIYDHDFIKKILTDYEIPAAYQGEGLVNSPLPFLFGANRETLLNRFWIRPITPASAIDEYWLQIVPKRIEDARTYCRVELVIARQDFLPKSIVLFLSGYDPKENPVSQAYVFENRKINAQMAAIQDFWGLFIRPKTPLGWERVEQKPLGEDSATAQRAELERSRK